jgi:beta-lactamase regulating signal transducer with metallopeptidase domain
VTVTPTPTVNDTASASTESVEAPVTNPQTDTPADSLATSVPSPTTVLRSSTSNALQTTPTIVGLGVILLIALVVLVVLAINARRKKLALRSKQSAADTEDRVPTMMSPQSPSAYFPAQTPTHNFAVLY